MSLSQCCGTRWQQDPGWPRGGGSSGVLTLVLSATRLKPLSLLEISVLV